MENRTQNQIGCSPGDDDVFGPAISSTCRGGFDFTLLFEQSILSIGPSAVLLLVCIVQSNLLQRRKPVRDVGILRPLKLFLYVIFGVLQVAALVLWSLPSRPRTNYSVTSAALGILVVAAMALVSSLQHTHSPRPSFILNVYLLFSLFFDIIQTRTLWLVRSHTALAAISTAMVVLKLILMVLEAHEDHSGDAEARLSPESRSGIYSLSVFWWLNGLLMSGFRKVLRVEELYELDDRIGSRVMGAKLRREWRRARHITKHRLFWAMFSAMRWLLIAPIFPRVCLTGFRYAQPFLINAVVDLVSEKNALNDNTRSTGLILGALLIYLGIAISTGQFNYTKFRAITAIRGCLVDMVYEKTLDLQEEQTRENKALTLASTDVERIAFALEQIHEIWASTAEVGIAIYLLKLRVGAACAMPVIIALVAYVGNVQVAKRVPLRQKIWLQAVQQRVSLTSSFVGNIKSYKLTGLADWACGFLQEERVEEVKRAKSFRKFVTLLNAFAQMPTQLAPALTFLMFITVPSISHRVMLSSGQAFAVLSIIQLCTSPLALVLALIPTFMTALACLDRIEEYLLSKGHGDQNQIGISGAPNTASESSQNLDGQLDTLQSLTTTLVSIDHGSFTFNDQEAPVLKDIHLNCKQGSLTIITGPTGAGKSSLLKAILGELQPCQGVVKLSSSRVAYVQQSPWLFQGTVRDNIIVQSTFDADWYRTVIKCTALEELLQNLPAGDFTRVGSRGVGLSGGQRQRIAVARAVYTRADVVIMDDVLSALDSHTSSVVAERLFAPQGLFRQLSICVIVATQNVRTFQLPDQIVVLGSDGRILEQGDLPSLKEAVIDDLEIQNQPNPGSQIDDASLTADDGDDKVAFTHSFEKEPSGSRGTGDVALYKFYYTSIGFWNSFIHLLLGISAVFFLEFQQIWLEWWTASSDKHNLRFAVVYCAYAVAGLSSAVAWIWWLCMRVGASAAENLHWTLINTIAQAPLSYFTNTDAGAIIGRFSQDLNLIDTQLPTSVFQTTLAFLLCITQLVLIVIGTKYLSLTVPFVLVVAFSIQKFYLRTSRQLRILDLEARGPLYGLITETLEGLLVIRAAKWQNQFRERFIILLHTSQRPYYLLFCVQRWLNFLLDIITTALAVVLVTLATQMKSTTSAAAIGVSMVNLLGFSESLTDLVVAYTTLETSLGAVARIKQQADEIKPEMPANASVSPPNDWPNRGQIDLDSVTAGYFETSPPVLRDITFSVKPGQKVGICGKSGSGKTSLMLTLFGIIPISEGSLTIDGLNISFIQPNTLRSRLNALPQESLILPRSARFNASPAGNTTDIETIAALEEVGLWEVLKQRGGLDAILDDPPLSYGQQQLFCLARAMLKKGTILVLDEATSSIDHDSEKVIRDVIQRKFRDRTVLTIAHRLANIVDNDLVLVLDDGRLIESGSPQELLTQKSHFKDLWDAQEY